MEHTCEEFSKIPTRFVKKYTHNFFTYELPNYYFTILLQITRKNIESLKIKTIEHHTQKPVNVKCYKMYNCVLCLV